MEEKSSNRMQNHLSEIIIAERISNENNFSFIELSALLMRFLNRLKTSGKSVNTMIAYRNDLNLFCEFLMEKKISPQSYAEHLQEHWIYFLKKNNRQSQASLRRAHMSVRTFMHFLIAEKIISHSPLLESKSAKQPNPVLLAVPREKFFILVHKLKQQAELGDAKAVRDFALVLILGECALKASEAAQLTWGDVLSEFEKQEHNKVSTGCLRILGEKERIIPYSHEVARALSMLKKVRLQLDLSTELSAKLFFAYLNVSRKTTTLALHRHGIKFVIYEICTEILGVFYNSESLRNHAIIQWINKGLDLEKIANLAGYSSLNSLSRFLKNTERKLKSGRKITKQFNQQK